MSLLTFAKEKGKVYSNGILNLLEVKKEKKASVTVALHFLGV